MAIDNWTNEQIKDLKAWEYWDARGRRTKDLQPLLNRMEPLIYKKMAPFKSMKNIPNSAVKAEFQKQTINAIESYEPKRGVPLSYHAMRNMDAAKRYIYDYQNDARIPSHRVRKIGDFKASYSKLERKLNRPPTALELSDELKWPVKEVSRMSKELRNDLLPWKGSGAEEAFTIQTPREREVLELIPYELDDIERGVFEFTYGQGGKPTLGTSETAKAMNLSNSKVSRTKAKIADKIAAYLGDV